MNKNIENIGILGGSFDPAHKGHLKISVEAKKKFKLKKIIWAVTKKSPFKKKTFFNLRKRIKIAKKITSEKNYITFNFFENKIKSNRTIKLIKYIKKKYDNKNIYLIMGADNLINFHKWMQWKKILLNSKILVFDRKGYKEKSLKSVTFKRYNKKFVYFVKFKKVNISSSKLKEI